MKFKKFKFQKVKNTNDTAIRLIRKNISESGMVVADSQLSGRGQYGRKWISYKGNLFVSFFYKMNTKKISIATITKINCFLVKRLISKYTKKKIIYKKQEKELPVNVTSLSHYFNVSKSTVSNMIKKLVLMGLIDSKPYKPILLTSLGKTKATEIISKHRLIELYLVEKMNFKLDEVHEIAEEIEHIKNSKFFNRMREILGDASIDPHGSVIPDYDY